MIKGYFMARVDRYKRVVIVGVDQLGTELVPIWAETWHQLILNVAPSHHLYFFRLI